MVEHVAGNTEEERATLAVADSVAWDGMEHDVQPLEIPLTAQIDRAKDNDGIDPSLTVERNLGGVGIDGQPLWVVE